MNHIYNIIHRKRMSDDLKIQHQHFHNIKTQEKLFYSFKNEPIRRKTYNFDHFVHIKSYIRIIYMCVKHVSHHPISKPTSRRDNIIMKKKTHISNNVRVPRKKWVNTWFRNEKKADRLKSSSGQSLQNDKLIWAETTRHKTLSKFWKVLRRAWLLSTHATPKFHPFFPRTANDQPP